MSWTEAELAAVGGADELELASRRADATLRPFVTIWVVRVGSSLYVRSAYGPSNGWFRRALASGTGQIRAGGLTSDVVFSPAPADAAPAIDRAYHEKYDRYGPAIVGSVVGAAVAPLTIRLLKETPR
jgi:hypothetical protein